MKKGIRAATIALFFVVASCAVITVNIYFPEKDVKEAYKTLEKELMDLDKKPATKPDDKPQSSLRFEFIASASAQEPGLADKISETVKKMPDVVNAYMEMGVRIADTDRLRDSGAAGEGKNGMIIDVIGSRGGVGNTTIAVNLAFNLAQMDRSKSVALIDLNLVLGEVPCFLEASAISLKRYSLPARRAESPVHCSVSPSTA